MKGRGQQEDGRIRVARRQLNCIGKLSGRNALLVTLRNIRQADAVRAFVRKGGKERRGKGSHRVVTMNGNNLSVPHGILKVGLLKTLIKRSGLTEQEFLDNV